MCYTIIIEKEENYIINTYPFMITYLLIIFSLLPFENFELFYNFYFNIVTQVF